MFKSCFVVLSVVLVTVQVHGWAHTLHLASEVPYLDCGPTTATIQDVTVNDCMHKGSCDVEAGSVANIHVEFTPPVAANVVTLDVYKYNKRLDKYISYLSQDVCGSGLDCPLEREKTITITKGIPFLDLTEERHMMKATLTNEQNETLSCAVFMTNVVL